MAVRESIDNDEENDVYHLDENDLPDCGEHICTPSGIEYLVKEFKTTLTERIRCDPLQPYPTLYETVRTEYSRKLKYDQRHIFLAEIPTYDSIQRSLYEIRRQYVPRAPLSQDDFDINLEWMNIKTTRDLYDTCL